MICVVIPYFQREPGILRRALDSVSAQQGCALCVQVIVVDDASPAPAEPEVEASQCSSHGVIVVHQANGGPGAARNAGLDHCPAGTRYVAFLDSDDEWAADHLARATRALRSGFDFYFADHLQLGAERSAFVRGGRIKASDHRLIECGAPALFEYHGNLYDQTLRANVIGTSTVVYDFQRFSAQRFEPAFASAGEDYLFWMDLAQSGAKAAFSTQCAATYGRGVNVYARAGWGSDGHLRRIHDEVRFKKTVASRYPVAPVQKAHLQSALVALRADFAQDVVHRLRHRKPLDWRLLRSHLRLDPMSFVRLLPNAVRLLFDTRT